MSSREDETDDLGEAKPTPGSSKIRQRARAHKINDLISHLPPEQQAMINERLARSAPQLVQQRGHGHSSSSSGGLDTPMKRARSLARSLLKRERAARLRREQLGINAERGPRTLDELDHDLSSRGLTRSTRQIDPFDPFDPTDPFSQESDVGSDGYVAPPAPPQSRLSQLDALRRLDAPSLIKVYRASPLADWLSALKIAEPELKEHLLYVLPLDLAGELDEALRGLGPLKLSEAQTAERQVLKRAQALETRGELAWR